MKALRSAGLAQPVERLIRNHEVIGPNPISSSMNPCGLCVCGGFCFTDLVCSEGTDGHCRLHYAAKGGTVCVRPCGGVVLLESVLPGSAQALYTPRAPRTSGPCRPEGSEICFRRHNSLSVAEAVFLKTGRIGTLLPVPGLYSSTPFPQHTNKF